jgi:hypothetical protein
MEIIFFLVIAAITIYPLWRIFEKTGQTPALSLLVLLPSIGPMIVALIFGRGRWPRYPDSEPG